LCLLSRVGQGTANDGIFTMLALYWIASLLPLVGLAKVGSNRNYWVEAGAATAVLATSGIWSWRTGRLPFGYRWLTGAALALLALNLVFLLPFLGAAIVSGKHPLYAAAVDRGAFDQLVERLRSEPAEVLADPLDV